MSPVIAQGEARLMKKKRLGEVLRERNQVSADDLNKAIQDQQGKLVHLGELMLQRGIVSKDNLVSALAEVSRIPYVDCSSVSIDDSTLSLVPAAMAKRCCALPLAVDGSKLVVVLAEPQNLQLLDELRFKSGMIIEPRMGFRSELEAALEKFYGAIEPVVINPADSPVLHRKASDAAHESEMEFISFSSQERNVEAMREMQSELLQKSKTTPAVMVVASMIKAAAERRASDIHIEPQSDGTAVRFRVDGMLRDYQRLPKSPAELGGLPHQDPLRNGHRRTPRPTRRPLPRKNWRPPH